jgi:hypothetical protein
MSWNNGQASREIQIKKGQTKSSRTNKDNYVFFFLRKSPPIKHLCPYANHGYDYYHKFLERKLSHTNGHFKMINL